MAVPYSGGRQGTISSPHIQHICYYKILPAFAWITIITDGWLAQHDLDFVYYPYLFKHQQNKVYDNIEGLEFTNMIQI
jgi:hypothetical protein